MDKEIFLTEAGTSSILKAGENVASRAELNAGPHFSFLGFLTNSEKKKLMAENLWKTAMAQIKPGEIRVRGYDVFNLR